MKHYGKLAVLILALVGFVLVFAGFLIR